MFKHHGTHNKVVMDRPILCPKCGKPANGISEQRDFQRNILHVLCGDCGPVEISRADLVKLLPESDDAGKS